MVGSGTAPTACLSTTRATSGTPVRSTRDGLGPCRDRDDIARSRCVEARKSSPYTNQVRSGDTFPMPDFDLFVIGGGSGGVACARRAASHGARVGIAEHSRVGGTCVIRGCVPKKLMHYGAHFAEWFKAARHYGWDIGEPGLAFERLCERPEHRDRAAERHLPADARARRRAAVPDAMPASCRAATATRFVVAAGAVEVTAARVLVAVGARPSLPEIPGIELAITSDQILEDVYPLPERLAVVGAGYIGLELASIFNGLGAHTTLILRGDLPLRGFEQDLRQHLTVEVEGHGVCLWNETRGRAHRAAHRAACAWHTSRGAARGRRRHLRHRPRRPCRRPRGLGLEEHRRPPATRPARSRSTPPTAAATPASSRSATAATMPAPRSTACRSTSPRSPSPRAGRWPRPSSTPTLQTVELRHHPHRRVRPAPGGLGRPVRGQGARRRATRSPSTAPASGRCSTR